MNKNGLGSTPTNNQDKGTIIQEENNDHATIPYQSNASLLKEQDDQPEEDEDVALLMREESILIKVAKTKQLEADKEARIAYRYLFWACTRNYIFIVHHILMRYGISPFMAEKEDLRSPFMAAIENN